MSEEIKETLDRTLEYLEGIDKTRNTKILTTNEANILLDYITNLQQKVEQKDKEIDRLNNIINELEEYINPYLYMLNGIQDRDIYEQCQLDDFTDIMEKLQELKENNK